MNFWETVDSELKYQNKERKDLANAAGFDVSNIGKYNKPKIWTKNSKNSEFAVL